MKIEVGKDWTTRNGLRVYGLRHDKGCFPFIVVGLIDGKVGQFSWEPNGSYIDKHEKHPLDLISPWEDSPTQIKSESNVTPEQLANYGGDTPVPQQKCSEPASKFDAGKAPVDLFDPAFVIEVSEVLDFGAKKYAARNWEKGMSWGRCYGALCRHIFAWWRGEDLDAETGLSHLAHAGCCLMFLAAYRRESRYAQFDDRPSH